MFTGNKLLNKILSYGQTDKSYKGICYTRRLELILAKLTLSQEDMQRLQHKSLDASTVKSLVTTKGSATDILKRFSKSRINGNYGGYRKDKPGMGEEYIYLLCNTMYNKVMIFDVI